MSTGQVRPWPAKVAKERLEKDTESDVGADPCRLDGKASGCNDIAIE